MLSVWSGCNEIFADRFSECSGTLPRGKYRFKKCSYSLSWYLILAWWNIASGVRNVNLHTIYDWYKRSPEWFFFFVVMCDSLSYAQSERHFMYVVINSEFWQKWAFGAVMTTKSQMLSNQDQQLGHICVRFSSAVSDSSFLWHKVSLCLNVYHAGSKISTFTSYCCLLLTAEYYLQLDV